MSKPIKFVVVVVVIVVVFVQKSKDQNIFGQKENYVKKILAKTF